MAVISFSDRPEDIWCVAGWAFRQILDDVIFQKKDDKEMTGEFEHAKRISGLHLYLVERELADRITKSIKDVANAILSKTIQSGIVEQPYGDAATVQQYLGSLEDLLRIISNRGSGDQS